jgi:hypothetical protein
MRKFLFDAAALVALAAAISGIPSSAQAQPYYGGMMGGYGRYGMMGGYGGYDGYAMGPGMMGEYGYGPGMMYGYSPYGGRHHYRRAPHYRGRYLCWHQTGARGGYYGSCSP